MLRIPTLLTLFLLTTASLAFSQGSTREDRDLVQDLPEYRAGLDPDGPPTSVDLRPFLPEVGRQTMNDCAAWAFGYAARSYLEAIDQGWKPDSPERIFSPTFVYNQVNGGVDKGSQVTKVLELMMQKGAATLATAPYLARDFLTQPPVAAIAEAGTFRIEGFVVLEDGNSIKQALADGNIVLCCVRTNPVFSSGRYDLYTKEMHERGQAARRPDQPHGFHAMAIVGYSDERGGFLFMNSWGKGWGDAGFVWVGYDVLEQFNKDGITEHLMDFALVMIDRREPVKKTKDGYELLPLDQLHAAGFGTYSGYDEAAKSGNYRYTLSLRGTPELLEQVDRVDWKLPAAGGERVVTSNSRRSAFRLSFRSPAAKVRVLGLAHVKSGHTTEVALELEVPATRKRSLALERIDAFSAVQTVGNFWRWTLIPRMSDTDWADLQRIEWKLEADQFITAEQTYEHAGGLPPAWSFESLAMPSYYTTKPVGGSAILFFKDGSVHELLVPSTPFTDPVRDELQREVVWRPVGTDGDRSWYFYEIRVRYPESWAENILGVGVSTGNTVDWDSHEAQAVGGPGPLMHVFHGYARRPFASSQTAYFKRPHRQLGRSTPVTDYQVIQFGGEVAWTRPETKKPGTVHEGHGYDIEYEDRYVGEVDGKPMWEFDLYIDGTANVNAVEAVKWSLPDGEFAFTDEHGAEVGPQEGYMVTQRHGGPFTATIESTLYDGTVFQLEREVQPHAPRNDALAIDLTDRSPSELLKASASRALAHASLVGRAEDLEGLREVTGYSKRAWGGVLVEQLSAHAFNEEPKIDLGRIELPRDGENLFLLEYDDGSAIALTAKPHALAPQPSLPRLQLLARERFEGWREGLPRWEVELELRGDVNLLEQLVSVQWKAEGRAGGKVGEVHMTEDLRRASLETTGPARVRASLQFPGEVRTESVPLQTDVLTFSERHTGALRVRVERGWMEDLIEKYGPNVDPWSIEYPDTPYCLRLDGSARELERIKEVRWVVRDPLMESVAEKNGDSPPEPVIHTVTAARRDLGFACYAFVPNELERTVTPTLLLADGSEKQLERILLNDDLNTTQRRSGVWYTKARDWGLVDGRRAAIVICTSPPTQHAERLLRASFEFDKPLQPAADLPPAAYGRPHGRRAFLAFEDGKIIHFDLLHREEHASGFEASQKDPKSHGRFRMPSPIETKTIAMHASREGEGSFWYVSLRAPESFLSQTDRIAWSVWQDGKRSVYVVRDRIGERSDAFELRLSGSRPSRIEANTFGENGPLPGGKLRRNKP